MRLQVRTVLLAILTVGTAIGALMNPLLRAHRSAVLRANASSHALYAEACMKRIPDDFRQVLLCLEWEFERSPAPRGCVFDGIGLPNNEQLYHRTVMRPAMGYPGETPHRSFRGWTVEAVWWAREIWRDSVRAMWHKSMNNAYNRAAADPELTLPDESTEPYPDMSWLRLGV